MWNKIAIHFASHAWQKKIIHLKMWISVKTYFKCDEWHSAMQNFYYYSSILILKTQLELSGHRSLLNDLNTFESITFYIYRYRHFRNMYFRICSDSFIFRSLFRRNDDEWWDVCMHKICGCEHMKMRENLQFTSSQRKSDADGNEMLRVSLFRNH